MGKTFVFRCPVTGLNVQAHSEAHSKAEQPLAARQRRYEGVQCVACRRVHVVNPDTGRLLSEEIDET